MDTDNSTALQLKKKATKPRGKINTFFVSLYNIHKFIIRFFKEAFVPPFEFKEIVRQCYEVGVRSFTLISLTGFIVGLIFTKQSRPSLGQFGATSWLPSLVSIAIMRALAPLVTACTGWTAVRTITYPSSLVLTSYWRASGRYCADRPRAPAPATPLVM